MKVFIPENLDVPSLLVTAPPNFAFRLDNFYYILSLINSIPSSNKELLESDYTPLHSKLLKTIVNNYKRYVQYLVEYEVIETDNRYIIHEKSKGYRFTAKYRTRLKPHILTDTCLIRKIMKPAKAKITRAKRRYIYLTKWINPSLRIDVSSAYQLINQFFILDARDDFDKALLKQNCAAINVNRLSSCDFNYSVDKTVGRFHSPLTRLKGELRNFITYDGIDLVAVDIKNSQPYFSTLLFNPGFFAGKPSSTTLSLRDISTNYKVTTTISKEWCKYLTDYYIMWEDSPESHNGKGFQRYIEHVTSGAFHDLMRDAYYEQTGEYIADRGQIKAMVFLTMFTGNGFLHQEGKYFYFDKKKKEYVKQMDAAGKRIFKSIYPDVYDIFNKIKENGKQILPCILQAVEAHIMLNVVARRISKERPGMPIFTIHDSIVCPVGHEDYVAAVMREEMERLVGYPPSLKYEYWKPENAWQALAEKQAKAGLNKAA